MTTTEHTVPPEDLMAYVDGELPPAQAARIEAHVGGCRSCQATVTELRQVSHDLAQWSVEPPRPATPPRRRSGAWHWLHSLRSFQLRPLAQLATVGVVLCIAGSIWITSEMNSSSTRTLARKRPIMAAAESAEVTKGAAPTQFLGGAAGQGASVPEAVGSNVIRTASLALVTKAFDAARPAIERTLREAGGFVAQMQVSDGRGNVRTLTASLRVPSAQLDATLATLRGLGQVTNESQGGEDVTTQVIDLEARLKNSRNTENRLVDVLKNRTGRVSDVLEVEREIARVRSEIEQFEAQRKQLRDRVAYATVSVSVTEERQASIDTGTLTFGSQLRNALVDGVQVAYESAAGALLALLRIAPFVALWALVLWWPIRRVVRIVRTSEPSR
jgi:anti-sigma factor RsiW